MVFMLLRSLVPAGLLKISSFSCHMLQGDGHGPGPVPDEPPAAPAAAAAAEPEAARLAAGGGVARPGEGWAHVTLTHAARKMGPGCCCRTSSSGDCSALQ